MRTTACNQNSKAEARPSAYCFLNLILQEAEKSPFNTTEWALYLCLLTIANRQHWEMPIRCHTSMLGFLLKTSKQNILKARESLCERGMLAFRKGEKPGSPATYELTTLLTTSLTNQLTTSLTSPLTTSLTALNIQDKEKDNTNLTNMKNYGKQGYDRRRSAEVPDASPEIYEGAF